MSTTDIGKTYEQLALQFLTHQGLEFVTQNYLTRYGEIDLIMRDNKTLVFIEVRRRASATYGGAAASVSLAKQRKIILAAQHFLKSLHSIPVCRFDVVAINFGETIDWIQNAFSAENLD